MFPANTAGPVNHGMVLEGYEQGSHWWARNSYGPDWGEGGYMRLPMLGDGPGASSEWA